MPKIWLQDWGTYGEQTLVGFGNPTKQDFLKFLKKIKAKPAFIHSVEESFHIPEGADGCFWCNNNVAGSILWFQSDQVDTHSVGVIAHEICHAVTKMLIERRGMRNEVEAICYQTEYLTKNILKEALS